tara:strand:+ start:6139 stop:6597 length:459 start_codon:yes stop_codon:yes gene_type:complete
MLKEKILFNRPITEEQVDLFVVYLQSSGVYDKLYYNYMYVEISSSIDNVLYRMIKNSKIHNLCDKYSMTAKEAVTYCFNSFEFFQDLREILYWNNINNYKKYMPCTGEIRTKEGIEPVVEDDYLIAKGEEEAMKMFNNIGYDNLMYVIDVDE